MHLYSYTTDRLSELSTQVMQAVFDNLETMGYLTEEEAEALSDSCLIEIKEISVWKRLWKKHFAKNKGSDDALGILMVRRVGSESQGERQGTDEPK